MENIKALVLIVCALGSTALLFVVWFIATQMGTRHYDINQNNKDISIKCTLKNGEYLLVYDKEYSGYDNYRFLVNDNILTYHQTEHLETKIINWKSDTTFVLDSTRPTGDSLNPIARRLNSLGIAYYEITQCKKDTLKFIFWRKPNIIINSGVFVHQKSH